MVFSTPYILRRYVLVLLNVYTSYLGHPIYLSISPHYYHYPNVLDTVVLATGDTVGCIPLIQSTVINAFKGRVSRY